MSHTYLDFVCSTLAEGAARFLQARGFEPMAFMACSLVDFFGTRAERRMSTPLDSALCCTSGFPELFVPCSDIDSLSWRLVYRSPCMSSLAGNVSGQHSPSDVGLRGDAFVMAVAPEGKLNCGGWYCNGNL